MSIASLSTLPFTIAIPTFGREEVLLDTIRMLLAMNPRAEEILVLDQTPVHETATQAQLQMWHDEGSIRWLHLSRPSQPAALNVALRKACQEYVLFLDDDIRIEKTFLSAHWSGFQDERVWCVAGQVLQPGETPDNDYVHQVSQHPTADIEFLFRSNRRVHIANGMSGNLSVRRSRAIEVGGFDENFLPPVAYRFDADFCKRVVRAGGQIVFEPSARIFHLRAVRGGTRSRSNHLTSISPDHGVGDYYFALRNLTGLSCWRYVFYRMYREVRTKFHLKHPWYIPVKLIGEVRALALALKLRRAGPVYCRANDE